jgi:hypothetical protein
VSFSTSVWSTFPLLGHDAPDSRGGWYNNHRGQVMLCPLLSPVESLTPDPAWFIGGRSGLSLIALSRQ